MHPGTGDDSVQAAHAGTVRTGGLWRGLVEARMAEPLACTYIYASTDLSCTYISCTTLS